MIWRIRERRAFQRLTAEGRRVRAGVLWCTYVLDPHDSPTPPRVAFALGRALGPAVVRNRVRRQLRDLLRSAARQGTLRPGTYLFGAQPTAASRSYGELTFDLTALLSRVGG